MKKLLTLKHWQLFLPMIIVLVPLQILMTMAESGASTQDIISVAIILGILGSLNAFLFFGWLYAAATNLYKRLPGAVTMSLTRFRIFFFIPIVYISSILIFVPLLISDIISFTDFNPALLLLIIPLHIFSIFCIFYCFYFNAKALKAVETQGALKSDAFIGEFFLIWYFPIGVWFLQPRMNKIFSSQEEYNELA